MTRPDEAAPAAGPTDPTGPVRTGRRRALPRPSRVVSGLLVVGLAAVLLVPDRLGLDMTFLGYRSFSSVPPSDPDALGTTILAGPTLGDVRARTVPARFPWLELTGGALGATRLVGVHVVSPVPALIDAWPGELESLARWCAPGAGPAAVVGDLNATADLTAFRRGTAGCTEAGDEAGKGLLATWPTGLPRWLGAQLDRVLVGGGVGVDGFDVVEVPGTDHRGLLVTVHAVA